MVGSHLHRFKTDARYCGVDHESEGLNLFTSRPFQISWVITDNKQVIVPPKMRYIWWPDLDVAPRAAEITRFDYGAYKAAARPALEVLEEYEADIMREDTEVVWMNGLGADLYFHRTWRRALGLPLNDSYLIRSIDLKALTQALKKGWQPDTSSPAAFLAWQYRAHGYVEKGLKSNLADCGKEERIEHDYSTLHDSTSDIMLMMKVFWRRVNQLDF